MSDSNKISKARKCKGLAAEYLTESGKSLAHYHGRWYEYTGTHYASVEDLPVLIRQFCLKKDHDASVGEILEILDNLKGMRYLSGATAQPSWIREQQTDPADTISFRNGLLEVSTGRFLPHSQNYFAFHVLPYDYDPAATCNLWLNHLQTVMGEDEARLLQEYLGYCLTGAPPVYEKFLMIQGPPGSGKGTTAEVLMQCIGKEHTAGLRMSRLADRFGLAELEDKKLAFIDEINLDPWQKNGVLEVFNKIIGRAPCTIERKQMQGYSAPLPVRFLLACNKIPVFFEATGAFSRRLLLIQLKKSFVGREDVTLKERLAAELSGVCNWGIEGLRRLRQQNGFTATNMKLREENRRDSSDCYAFACDCLMVRKLAKG